ncbi:MATE family efflux transporter [Pseudoflavonifractor sp. BIOML-A6]|nr:MULTISPECIES: MATE family efflux transporter [unclassified Pseudoflavonifractor]MTQ97731.1 MATE family efflux transporter [Pseudoflavonifractor sp. BIOML-A16]MTR06718.1 MATE family efflux transporter [Pseudoflavonifractor sp. BIOML-A15]MTR33286.1 MATE family efflux transporter [Pseudoflavonifractor sp. BIOML-A14]MTR73970.1 MATE family efflux transporter [Pseudoflavonifractor sp. BIOML-A18]MTS64740.1 MATE family efflux transporter [Pseudoflavonifractor sp. BIOML-A5]MTS72932.1 MATE family ef
MEHSASEAQYLKMTGTPIPRLITSLAVPTIISMLITGIYNLADTYFVSLLHSDSATAAVGVVFSLMALIQAVGFTLGMGSGSLISRLLGRQQKEAADTVLSSGFTAAVLFGVLVTAMGLIFIDPLMAALGSSETILPYARSYAQYILFGAPIMAASFVLNNVLRAEGHATLSMAGITIGGILNIVLDPIFILREITLPFGIALPGLNLGTAGAAIATLLSQCISFLILFSCFLTRKSILHLSVRNVARRGRQYWDIVCTGLPSFSRQGLAVIATVALNHAAMVYGDPAVAGMSVVGRVFMLIISALIGFGQGYQPVVGYNYGARRFDRVRESFFFSLKTASVMMGILAIIGWLAAPRVIGMFGSGQMQEIGTFAMRAQCVGLLFQTLGVLSNMTFQAVGKSWQATFLSSCRQGVYFLPLILILPRVAGLTGVEITQPLADVCTFVTCIPFLAAFFRDLKAKSAEDGGPLPESV